MIEGERAIKRPKRMRRAERDAQRSQVTRTRLLEAALDVLVEKGHAGFNTVAVCERASAPRGTMLHHFPSRASLLIASLEHVLLRRLESYSAAMTTREPRDATETPVRKPDSAVETRRALLDMLWAEFTGPASSAWLELVVAARTDPDLAHQLREVAERFDRSVRAAYLAFVPGATLGDGTGGTGLAFVFATLNGLALERTYRDGLDVAPILDALARIGELLPPRPSKPQPVLSEERIVQSEERTEAT